MNCWIETQTHSGSGCVCNINVFSRFICVKRGSTVPVEVRYVGWACLPVHTVVMYIKVQYAFMYVHINYNASWTRSVSVFVSQRV